MIQTLVERISNFWLRRKIHQRRKLTPLEVLRVASSPRLMQEATDYGIQLVLFLPPSVIITGLENLRVEGDVRIHCTRSMMVSTTKRLHINPKDYKNTRFVSAKEIEEYDRYTVAHAEELLPSVAGEVILHDSKSRLDNTLVCECHSVKYN